MNEQTKEWMNIKLRWNDTDRRRRSTLRKPCPYGHLSTTNHTRIGPVLHTCHRVERPTTNHMSHGTVQIHVKTFLTIIRVKADLPATSVPFKFLYFSPQTVIIDTLPSPFANRRLQFYTDNSSDSASCLFFFQLPLSSLYFKVTQTPTSSSSFPRSFFLPLYFLSNNVFLGTSLQAICNQTSQHLLLNQLWVNSHLSLLLLFIYLSFQRSIRVDMELVLT